MPLSTLVFLTPKAALFGLAFLVPLLVLAFRERRAARVRSELRMPPPSLRRRALRPLVLALVGALVAATGAQPALRKTNGSKVRTDAEIYLAFDVTRSMLARSPQGGLDRLDRARLLAQRIHADFLNVPTGVATITNRMMPLLFPTNDAHDVPAVITRSLKIMQPPPAQVSGQRATSLAAIVLAAQRTYFDPSARRRALVVLSDADSDPFNPAAVRRLLRQSHIKPFLVRVAKPGERIYGSNEKPEAYLSISTLTIPGLRRAGWYAYDEGQLQQAISDIRRYLGRGPTRPSGVVETQHNYAALVALAALLLTAGLAAPSFLAGLGGSRLRSRSACR